jgi:hypothetical protein
MAARCGLDVEAAARDGARLRGAEPAAIFYDLGVEQAPFSTLNAYLIRLLLTLTATWGRSAATCSSRRSCRRSVDRERVSEPERAIASGIPAIRRSGNFAMMLADARARRRCWSTTRAHPRRHRRRLEPDPLVLRRVALARGARELDLLVVIDPAMTRRRGSPTTSCPCRRATRSGRSASFPRGAPEIYDAGAAARRAERDRRLTEPEIYVRLAEAMDLFGAPPAELCELAKQRAHARGAMAFLGTAQAASTGGENQLRSGPTGRSARTCRRPRSRRCGSSRT